MGLKLEFLLVVLIVLTSVVTMSVKLRTQHPDDTGAQKELEFTNTTFTEVTTQKREGVAFGVHGVRSAGILRVKSLRYHNDTIDLLLADTGTYRGDHLYLDGNVTLHQRDGFDYWTEHAYYDKKKAILYATSPFIATKGKNRIDGKSMAYHTVKKVLRAISVDAVVYTAEK
jgi:hypothetical protein